MPTPSDTYDPDRARRAAIGTHLLAVAEQRYPDGRGAIAAAVGVSPETLYRIEHGQTTPSPSTRAAIEQALGLTSGHVRDLYDHAHVDERGRVTLPDPGAPPIDDRVTLVAVPRDLMAGLGPADVERVRARAMLAALDAIDEARQR